MSPREAIEKALQNGSATEGPRIRLPEPAKRVRLQPKLRGSHCKSISVILPFPPSVNHMYATVGKRRVLTKKGRQYPKDVATCCFEQHIGHVKGLLNIAIWAYPRDKRKHDCDNLLKATLDGLQKAGVFSDDSQIRKITIQRCDPCKPGHLYVCIEGDLF